LEENNNLEPVEVVDDIPFHYVEDEIWQAAIGHFRMRVANYLGVFDMYGMGQFITPVTQQIVDAAVDLTMVARGEDRPIGQKHEPLPKLRSDD
jgi:hypothetical protein